MTQQRIMNQIITDGFLSPDIHNWKRKIHDQFSDIFSLAYDLNRFAQKQLFSMEVHNDNAKEPLIATFYIRSLSSFQGTIILLEKGMLNEAKILCRNLIEILFALVACIKHDDIVKHYVMSDDIDKIKSLNKLITYHKEDKEKIDLTELEKKKSDLKKNLDDITKTDLTTEYLSRKAGLHNHYLTVYHLLSKTVHIKIGDLDTHIKEEGKYFNWGPIIEGVESLTFTAIAEFITIIMELMQFFKLKDIRVIKKYNEHCQQLMKDNKYGNLL